jgi:hypothetical protein
MSDLIFKLILIIGNFIYGLLFVHILFWVLNKLKLTKKSALIKISWKRKVVAALVWTILGEWLKYI